MLDPKTKRLASAKLSDFGTARELVNANIKTETILGTRGYTAPEVTEGGYGVKVDVWSFGVVLYYLAYGFLPTEIGGSYSIYTNRKVKYPDRPLYGLPKSYVDLMQKCLLFQPETRISMEGVLKHEYFASDPCVVLPKVPDFYVIDPGKPLLETSTYVVRRITYVPTKASLTVKILKGPISEAEKNVIIKAVNDLVLLRGCLDIYKLHQSFVVNGQYYFVLDSISGATLEDYINSLPAKRLSIETIRTYALIVANAISFMHARNIGHNKLSLSNIYLPEKESPKIAPKVKLAGYAPIVQEVISTRDRPMPDKDDVVGFGEFLQSLAFGDVQGNSPSKVSTVQTLKPADYKVVSELVKNCIEKIYLTPSQILKDPFFTKI